MPRSRLNEAMGFVQTGISGGIAPGAWLAGVVADEHGGLGGVLAVAVLGGRALAGAAPRLGRPIENAGDAAAGDRGC